MTLTKDIVPTLHDLAEASGKAIAPYFRANIDVENKGAERYDPVTAADRAGEQAIRTILSERFPEHGLFGEEMGVERGGADHVWVIDPIDGTRAFVQGLPTWGTLVGLMRDGQPVAGLMNQPFTRERYWADSEGSYFRGPDGETTTIKTRNAMLESAQMSTTDPGLFAAGLEQSSFEAVRSRVRTCRYGTDCYAYCLLAAGHIDIVMEAGLQAYDIVALIPIIERAGGRVTTWDGGEPTDGGRILACGDPALHEDVLALLAQVDV